MILVTLALLLGVSIWGPIEAIGVVLGVAFSVAAAIFAFTRERETKKGIQEDKLDSVVLAVVGKPASPDGTFAKVPGLVDNFNEYRKEQYQRQEKVDRQISEIKERLDEVANEYITNGGSTVKDDLVVIRTGLADLRQSVAGIINTQAEEKESSHAQ